MRAVKLAAPSAARPAGRCWTPSALWPARLLSSRLCARRDGSGSGSCSGSGGDGPEAQQQQQKQQQPPPQPPQPQQQPHPGGPEQAGAGGSLAVRRLPAPPSPYQLLLEGKRFVCTECGKCCQGSGEVWANDAELAAMARSLGLSRQHFLTRYTKAYSRKPGWRMLKALPNGDCVFLQNGTQCSVYGVRPLQCSTYPWWPELMDPVAWIAEGRAVCEGIEHEDALPVDAAQTAATLREATLYFADQQAAAQTAAAAGRKGGQRGAGGA